MKLRMQVIPNEDMDLFKLIQLMSSLNSEISYEPKDGIISMENYKEEDLKKVIKVLADAVDIKKIKMTPESDKNQIESRQHLQSVQFIDPNIEKQLNKLMQTIYGVMK